MSRFASRDRVSQPAFSAGRAPQEAYMIGFTRFRFQDDFLRAYRERAFRRASAALKMIFPKEAVKAAYTP